MSKVCSFLLIVLAGAFVYSQNVNNVLLVGHREYMTEVLTEVAHLLEEREWCNLKIPKFEMDIQQVVFGWQINGPVYFENGFVVSIKRLEVLESSLNQIWSWNAAGGNGQVEVRGILRLHNVNVGFDVTANFNGNIYRSTATYLHPLIDFDFSIFRNTATLETTVTVTSHLSASLNKLQFLPINNATYVITALYDRNSTFSGVSSWASEILQPIALDVVTNRVDFPVVCYDCSAA